MCSGVEINENAKTNGCGCEPNNLTPCVYIQSAVGDHCGICTGEDIVNGDCSDCKSCLATSCETTCLDSASDLAAVTACLSAMSEECRANCSGSCYNLQI